MIPIFGGIQVRSDPCVPELKVVHKQERKWARRLQHQRYRQFDVTYGPVIFYTGNMILVHPNNYEKMMALIPGAKP